jgi:hypothetical protein
MTWSISICLSRRVLSKYFQSEVFLKAKYEYIETVLPGCTGNDLSVQVLLPTKQ